MIPKDQITFLSKEPARISYILILLALIFDQRIRELKIPKAAQNDV